MYYVCIVIEKYFYNAICTSVCPPKIALIVKIMLANQTVPKIPVLKWYNPYRKVSLSFLQIIFFVQVFNC